MKKVLLVSLYILFSYQWSAAGIDQQFFIDDNTIEKEFHREDVSLYVDESGSNTIDQVLKQVFENGSGAYVNAKTSYAYWNKFTLVSNTAAQRKWILEVLDAHQELVEVYLFRDNKLIYSAKTGQLVKGSKDLYSHKNHVVDIPIASSDTLQCYVRYKSRVVGSMIFKLRTNGSFSSYGFKEYYFLGLYYGVLVLICFINIILFLLLKERIYLLYLVYVLSWVLSSMIDDGIGKHLIWQDHHWIDHFGYHFALPILIISYVWYSLIFFKDQSTNKRITQAIVTTSSLFVAVHLIELLIGQTYAPTTILMFVPLILILYRAFTSYNNGYSPARFFILGNIFILLGLFVRFLQDEYIIKFVAYDTAIAIMAVYSRNIGVLLEVVTLTIALGDRFRFMKLQNEENQAILMKEYAEKEQLQGKVIQQLQENEQLKDKVNKELESKVQERTVELQQKSDELIHLNSQLNEQAEKINEMNRLLDLDNYKLKKEVKEVSSSRVLFKDLSFEEFQVLYPDKGSVLRYLNEHKWHDGYTCRKCSNTKHCDGNTRYARRCTKCRYDESITAFTIFHKCKFPLEQAFYIVSKTVRQGKDLNAQAVSEELGLRKNTVWNFKSKVLSTIEANKKSRNANDFLNIVILNPSN